MVNKDINCRTLTLKTIAKRGPGGPKEEKLDTNKANLMLPDTNVLINDRNAVVNMINGGNLVVISLTVLRELDKFKNNDRIGSEVREVIREIEEMVFSSNPNLVLERNFDFGDFNLDKEKPDDQIMATFNYVIRHDRYKDYQKFKLITDDRNMRIIAFGLFGDNPKVSIEQYRANLVPLKKIQRELPIISLQEKDVSIVYSPEIFGELPENGGALIQLGQEADGQAVQTMLTIRKGKKMEIIPPDLRLCGLRAVIKKEDRDEINWGQLLAFHQLMDKGIHCVAIQGPAGTGKTLMAIAAALEQRERFSERILINPMVPLSNQTKMGFLPGDIKEKSAPWLKPFEQNIHFLEKKQHDEMRSAFQEKKKANEKEKKSSKNGFSENNQPVPENLWEKYDFICQPLDYIRGQTITNAFIILEEAQNLSQHEAKSIITRVGEGTKIVLCGDLSQIDLPYISAHNSGLTYLIDKMSGSEHRDKMFAVSVLTETVRSKLAAFAADVLK